MDILDNEIREFLSRNRSLAGRERHEDVFPTAEELYLFVTDALDEKALQRMLNYLRNHPEDYELVKKARELLQRGAESESQEVPRRLLMKAGNLMGRQEALSCPHCGKPITPFRKGASRSLAMSALWLGASAASFTLSFVWPRYFFQWLVLALFFGFKWAVDQRARKTQILIYKALQEESKAGHREDTGAMGHSREGGNPHERF